MRAVSLFSNCGAGDLGYHQAGFRFDVMAELDPRRLKVCLLNHPNAIGIEGDLRLTWRSVIEAYRLRAGDERPALLAACPPCQGMSSARGKRGLTEDADAGSSDPRNLLVMVIAKVAQSLQPNAIVIENVPQFLTRKVRHPQTQKPISAAALIISLLNEDYYVFPILTDVCDYGVPQTRKRSFLTFIRKNLNGCQKLIDQQRTPYPVPSHTGVNGQPQPITIFEALHKIGFPPLDARNPQQAVCQDDMLHCVPVWRGKTERFYDMVAAIPLHTGQSAWSNDQCKHCGKVDVKTEDMYCPLCYQPLPRPLVKTGETHRFVKGFRTSSYRRMESHQPAATITTASGHIGSDNTIHPFENRLLSARECAYLQTFPHDFKWDLESFGIESTRAMIGEAVPPLFTKLHGQAIKHVLTNSTLTNNLLDANDVRCISALGKLHQQMTMNMDTQ